MNLKSLQCPNCHAPVERIEGANHMFCPYCGTKIVIDDIEFYKEDSKTARIENITNTISKVIGTKEERVKEKQRKEEQMEKARKEDLKRLPLWIALFTVIFALLAMAEHFGW